MNVVLSVRAYALHYIMIITEPWITAIVLYVHYTNIPRKMNGFWKADFSGKATASIT